MVRRVRFWVVPVVGLTLLAAGWATLAQEPEPPKTTGEKLKEKVGGAVESLKKGAVSAEEAIKTQFGRAKGAVVRMGIAGRVYSRLHWDKALVGSQIELSGSKPGSVVLSGTVPDAKAKAKALELTTDTVGVTEVIDNLKILTTTTPGTDEAPKP